MFTGFRRRSGARALGGPLSLGTQTIISAGSCIEVFNASSDQPCASGAPGGASYNSESHRDHWCSPK